MSKDRECISHRLAVKLTKYGLIPFLSLFFFTVCGIISLENFYYNPWVGFLFIIPICLALAVALLLYSAFQIINIDNKGIYYNQKEIVWEKIEKISFPIIRPQYLILYIKNKKSPIMTIIPRSQVNRTKQLIRYRLNQIKK